MNNKFKASTMKSLARKFGSTKSKLAKSKLANKFKSTERQFRVSTKPNIQIGKAGDKGFNPDTGVATYTPTLGEMKKAGLMRPDINRELRRQNRRNKQIIGQGFKTTLAKAAQNASIVKSLATAQQAENVTASQSLINGGATSTIPVGNNDGSTGSSGDKGDKGDQSGNPDWME